jgi:Concanavalin A-like lectin/glucanases superfamily/Family of unknown function (DUF6519)/Kelch motif
MRGTRYGDFSRVITGLRARQTALLMQQGRVQLDADWNAQAELAGRRLSAAIADILGASGAPATDPGFEVRPRERLEFSGHGAIIARRHLPMGQPGAGSFTIEMRVRWGGGAGTLIDLGGDRGDRGDRGGHLRLTVRGDGTLLFGQLSRGGTELASVAELAGSEPLTAGQDAHVAVVCRDGEAGIWVNSRPAGSARLTRTPAADEQLVVIGAAPARRRTYGQYVTGVIADVRIWDIARPASELGAPLRGDGPLPHGLLAWWPLDGPAASGLAERVSGEHATPDGSPPRWRLTDLEVSPGRFYVAGHMVSLDEPLVRPAWLPGAGAGAPLAPGQHLVYLEAWEESVSAAADPALAEPALGGLDSVVSTELAFNVRWVAAPPHRDGDPEQMLSAALHAAGAATTGELAADHQGPPVTGNWLYRVEIHQGGHTEAELTEVDVAVDPASGAVTLAETWTGRHLARTEVEFVGVGPDGRQVTARRAVEPVGAAQDRRTLRVIGGAVQLAGLRNLRLRQPAPQPTFKWSRTNGADTIVVRAVKDHPASFHLVSGSLPPPDQVVEVLGRPAAADTGQPGTLRRVVSADSDSEQVTLDQDPPGAGAALVRLRLWDQAPGTPAPDGAVPLTAGQWIELEHGVRVRFGPGRYRAGDYWWVPVRQDGEAVLWERRDGHPRPRRPDGIERCYAPLALVEVGDELRVVDLRGTLRPVVRPTALGGAANGAEPDQPEPPQPAPPEAGPGTSTTDTAPPGGSGEDAEDAEDDEDEEDEDEDQAPAIPPGFAVLGPAGATAPGWRPTGVQVAIPRAWAAPVTLTLAQASPPVALVPRDGGLLLITATDVWTVEPVSGEVTRLDQLPEPRERFACAAVGDTILLLGGRRRGAERSDGRVLSFDAARGSWLTGRRPLIRPVDDPAVAVTANGAPDSGAARVHLLGGSGEQRGERVSGAHQVYDPAEDQWTTGPPLTQPRKGAAAGTVADAIYLFGGTTRRRGDDQVLSSADVYDEHARTWSEGPVLPAAGAVVVGAGDGGQLIAGVAPTPRQALRVIALDAGAGVWADLPCPPRRVQSPAMALHDGQLFLAGADAAGQVILMTLPPERPWFLFEPEAPRDAGR